MALLHRVKNWSPFRRRSFALNDLDRKLEQLLDFDEGFFVEAGANDGIAQSNTLYFERYRRWKGLLIEPIPELASRCRRNRPRCRVENVALVADETRSPFVDMQYCNLMSLVSGGMKSAEEERAHLAAGRDCQRIESYSLRVPAATLTAVLERQGVSRIDLVSLDVEGYELPVLKGLDLDRFRPRYMLIEARYRDELESYLRPVYEPIAELSVHDVLYRCTRPEEISR